MNVLLVIEGTYPWYRGGVSEWIYQYLLNSKGFNFTILQIATHPYLNSIFNESLYPITENVIEFKRIETPTYTTDWNVSLTKWYLENTRLIQQYCKNQDVVHVTNTGFAGWLGVEISNNFDLPLVLTEHAIYWLEVEKGAVALECGYHIPEGRGPKNDIVQLFKHIASKVYQSSNSIITVSESNIFYQRQLGANNIQYIPNGIPSNWINDNRLYSEIPTFGWVGRCAEMKNPLQFFDFVDEFKSLEFSANYLMLLCDAGEDELKKKVIERAKEYHSVKIVWNESAKEFYPKMNLLLITSHNESQPLVMFEALSKHVLPIGREVGDVSNKYGFTLPYNSSNREICEQIINLWNNKNNYNNYLECRTKLLKEQHTWDNIFKNYHLLLTELVYQVGLN